MAGVYVYGITAQPVRTVTRGMFGRPLRAMSIGDVYAIVERVPRMPRPTIRNLRAQSRVVAALVAGGTDILPMRFGAFVTDRAELEQLVGVRRSELRRALRRIVGRIQMTVRLRLEPLAQQKRHASRTPGTEYLRSAAQRVTRRNIHPAVRALQRAASPYARSTCLEWRGEPPAVAVLHHLVPRGRIRQYERSVLRAIASRGVDATVSGPWAPFAFAEAA